MDVNNVKQTLLTLAKSDPEFRKKLLRLSELVDQFTYPTPEVWFQLAPAMMDIMYAAGFGGKIHTQDSLNEFNDWLFEHVNELVLSTQQREKEISSRYQQRVGKVFLSWTVKNPRGRECLLGIESALDYFNIEYFDYTEHELSGVGDLSAQIEEQLSGAVDSSVVTIEVRSASIGSKWIDWERYYIKNGQILLRVFVCLETEIANFMTMDPSEEKRVIRIDMSGGMSGGFDPSDYSQRALAEADISYYRSNDFFLDCFRLGRQIRMLLDLEKPSNWLKSFFDSITLRELREQYEFITGARNNK